MKTLGIIFTLPLFLFSLINCGGTQNTNMEKSLVQNPPFKITEAYYQNWVAGIKEGGSGTNVHIVLNDLKPEVTIKNIYFREQILEAKNTAATPNEFVGYLRDVQRDMVMDADPLKETQNTPPKPFPFQLEENQAVVEYQFGGKNNYYKITNLSHKDMIPYPQANPNQHE
ncbi:hypothetical protein K8089_00180 [Aequorivita sp. F47161]|uniref:Lipoprotein n=1 Tax=Aequorivita vitellina TaxID=2874475 RepID=A0A9X1QUK5_9FLAO|nr:hypothetical protein [Aequorivita vitellina]MCG2417418.1 hypothetical protein [Aequorivita vitellina]